MNQYRPSVDVLLRVFSVVVGFSVANFWNWHPIEAKRWISLATLIMLLTLLMRFFLGAANHLEKTYCRRAAPNKIAAFVFNYSTALVFGGLIMWMAGSEAFVNFLHRALLILVFAFVISLIHICWYHKRKADKVYRYWLILNALQLLATLWCLRCSDFTDAQKADVLAGVYSVFMVADLALLLVWMGQRTAIQDGI